METALKNSLTQEDITLRGVVIFVVGVGLMSHAFSESAAYNKPEPIFKNELVLNPLDISFKPQIFYYILYLNLRNHLDVNSQLQSGSMYNPKLYT